MFRRLAPTIGLVAAFMPALAHAQTNIDQGKSSAEIFGNDCATCHKTTRGLANGQNSLTLSSFLREHYTVSREEASALAAYVLGAGGNGPAPAAGQKPAIDHAKATADEPKAGEPKREPKIASRPGRPATKLEEEGTPSTAKLQPEEDGKKPEEQGIAKPESATSRTGKPKREARPVTATRGHKEEIQEAAPPAQEAAPSAAATEKPASPGSGSAETAPTETSGQENGSTKSAAVSSESQPEDNTPVPRDDIPD